MLRNGFIAFISAALLLTLAVSADDSPVSGEFELTDQDGRLVTQASYDGKLRLVFFGFTRCPDICPGTLFEVARTMKMLGDRSNDVQPIFISIDPDNDTVEIIADYVRAFHPSLVGLTGSDEQIASTAKAFNVTYGVTKSADGFAPSEVYHSSYLFVMDRQGGFLDVIGYGAKPTAILAAIQRHL
jgi:protein SCO1/2